LPGVIVFQQVSAMQGTLVSKAGEKFSFQHEGFSGFTATRLHPVLRGINSSTNNWKP